MEPLEQVREKIRKKLVEAPDEKSSKHPFCLLIVEDEELNLDALVDIFKDEYEILAFSSGKTALEHLRENKPKVDLVLTDQRMPSMTGVQLLEEINRLYPRVMKIVLTGFTETRDLIDAINKGEVHRYITKPADPSVLRLEIKQALERYRLEQEKHQLVLVLMDKNKALESYQNELKKTNLEILQILGTLSDLKDAQRGKHALFVARASEYVAKRLSLSPDEILNAVQAAHLHDIGKLGLPDWVLKGAGATTEAAENYYRQHAILGEAVLLVSERLKDLAAIVRHHHEWWNGQGFPDGLRGEAIPLASRIIAAADGYDEFVIDLFQGKPHSGKASEAGVKFLKENSGVRFEPRVVTPLLEFLEQESAEGTERLLPLSQLEEGMVVSQDVLTERGFVLIPRGTKLKRDFLEKVKGFSAYIAVREPISVYA